MVDSNECALYPALRSIKDDSEPSTSLHQQPSHNSPFQYLITARLNFLSNHPTMSLKGKVGVITGGNKGIGKATALRLGQEGASVVINYNSDSKSADEVVAQIGKDRAIAVQANAGDIVGVEQLVKKAVDKFGKIDVLIANAGIMPMVDLAHMTEDVFDRTFALNVKGPMFLAQVRHAHNSFHCR